MHLATLYLKDFRLFAEKYLEFSPRVNMILGPNARGKTTVLEAISLLMTGRSFRTNQIKDMIREGADSFYIEASFVKCGVEQTLKFACSGKEKRIVYNSSVCPSAVSLLGLLQGGILVPDDIELVKGGPGCRRKYLDMQLAQVDPLYVHHLSRYHRAMQYRNLLLKRKQTAGIELWEQEMAKASAYLVIKRADAVAELKEVARAVMERLSGRNESLELEYHTRLGGVGAEELQVELKRLYARERSREARLGYTLFGPHKDDLRLLLALKEARHFASEGQQRSCVMALRLAEWKRMAAQTDELPLMLVDDVGISLDANRKSNVYTLIQDLAQVFLTATEEIHTAQLAGGSERVFQL